MVKMFRRSSTISCPDPRAQHTRGINGHCAGRASPPLFMELRDEVLVLGKESKPCGGELVNQELYPNCLTGWPGGRLSVKVPVRLAPPIQAPQIVRFSIFDSRMLLQPRDGLRHRER